MKIDEPKWGWLHYIDMWRGVEGVGWFAFPWNWRKSPKSR